MEIAAATAERCVVRLGLQLCAFRHHALVMGDTDEQVAVAHERMAHERWVARESRLYVRGWIPRRRIDGRGNPIPLGTSGRHALCFHESGSRVGFRREGAPPVL